MLLILLLSFLSQCHIREKIEVLTEIGEEMEQQFRHDSIDLSMNWGEKSFLVISFNNYDFSGKSWDNLEELANKAKDYVLASDPSLSDLTYIMIVFSYQEENKEPIRKAEFRIYRDEF